MTKQRFAGKKHSEICVRYILEKCSAHVMLCRSIINASPVYRKSQFFLKKCVIFDALNTFVYEILWVEEVLCNAIVSIIYNLFI